MNPRLAGFLTRLYPPRWLARYGAEYRMFLEERSVSTADILNVIGHAAVEHVLEDWRYGPSLIALLFSVVGGLYLASGHPGEAMAQYPALATAWLAMEAGALIVVMYALSIAIPLALELVSRRGAWILVLVSAAWAVLQYVPWRWTSGWLATLIAVFTAFAGTAGMRVVGEVAKIELVDFQKREPEDLEWLCPSLKYWLSKTGKWKPKRLEALRLSAMILGSTIFAAQLRRVWIIVGTSAGTSVALFWLMSTWIIVVQSVGLFWKDVCHPRELE